MEMASSRFIEFKVISCKDLKSFNFFQKLLVYALVYLAGDDSNQKLDDQKMQQQRTPTDKEGDGNPEWNHEMRFDLGLLEDCDHPLFIHFDLRHEGIMFGDKTIGQVLVPMTDLIQDSNAGVVRFVSYEVRTTDGKPNGVLHFSYKVSGISMATDSAHPQITGFPVRHHHQDQIQSSSSSSSEVESGSPKIQYPSLGLEYNTSQKSPPSPQYPIPFQENYYFQPDVYSHTPPPLPPQPPAWWAHGACYPNHPPPPPPPHGYQHRPWGPHGYSYGTPGYGPAAGHMENWPNRWQGHPSSSSWNAK
ncbi:hypothetical protein SLEP1_g51529 [Rubroshorea leprosula]|uniref:C2 domain-containing protein n=1 Tax=Rubroshorea leprosula TaxID=152421 RepID=A0AAV5M622_9ROSI|nr:hypothetical protein SLEP1_g51529 [Rubroshorea leprosula]